MLGDEEWNHLMLFLINYIFITSQVTKTWTTIAWVQIQATALALLSEPQVPHLYQTVRKMKWINTIKGQRAVINKTDPKNKLIKP